VSQVESPILEQFEAFLQTATGRGLLGIAIELGMSVKTGTSFIRICYTAGHTAGIEATAAVIVENAATTRARVK
jgi:hypothetical protein